MQLYQIFFSCTCGFKGILLNKDQATLNVCHWKGWVISERGKTYMYRCTCTLYCQNVNLSSLFTFTCLFNVVSLAYDISTLPVVGNVTIWNVHYDQVQCQNESQTKPKTKQWANDKLKESFLKET